MALMISLVARVNSSHPYLEDDPSSSLVYHHLRISPRLRFSTGTFARTANLHVQDIDETRHRAWTFSKKPSLTGLCKRI